MKVRRGQRALAIFPATTASQSHMAIASFCLHHVYSIVHKLASIATRSDLESCSSFSFELESNIKHDLNH
jgi:hypothetical protein